MEVDEGGRELAEGQGGNASTHVRKQPANEDRLEKFLGKGEEILKNFQSSISGFQSQTSKIKELASMMDVIREDVTQLKRKAVDSVAEDRPEKVRKTVLTIDSGSGNHQLSESESDSDSISVDGFFDNKEDHNVSTEYLDEIDNFFVEESVTGANISDKLAKVVNKSLRNRSDSDKMKMLREKHKRPANVENLQIPKVDGFLWEQIKSSTKTADFLRQKTIAEANQALVPVVKAMDLLTEKKPDLDKLKEYLGDTFKFLTNSVSDTNHHRRECIKKELMPKFKSLCNADHPPSNTKLFGDNLSEECKQLEASKKVKITEKAQNQHFLGQRGGLKSYNNQHLKQQYVARPQAKGTKSQNQTLYRHGKNFPVSGGKQKMLPHRKY